jgi:hypothetical protein
MRGPGLTPVLFAPLPQRVRPALLPCIKGHPLPRSVWGFVAAQPSTHGNGGGDCGGLRGTAGGLRRLAAGQQPLQTALLGRASGQRTNTR